MAGLGKPATATFALVAAHALLLVVSTDRRVNVGGADSGNCVASPCRSIGYALSQASAGDTIRVDAGTYSGPNNRNLQVSVANVSIIGAGRATTIIDLQKLGVGFALGAEAEASSIQSFTMLNGNCGAAEPPLEKNGAAFHMLRSQATIRDVTVRGMDCSYKDVEYMFFSGAAFYFKDSTALVENAEVIDCVANHGGGAAMWGNDKSVVRDSTFLRAIGLNWGGSLLAEEDSATSFVRVRFTEADSAYGGVVDDGGTAHVSFKECIFEYSTGRYGSATYHYADAYLYFEDCIFQHNVAVSATNYLNANTRPTFKNCTWYNNSAVEECGALRINYKGLYGPLIIDGCTFIGNRGTFGGALSIGFFVEGSVQFRDCYFEDNHATSLDGGAAKISLGTKEDVPGLDGTLPFFLRTRFVRNKAIVYGGGILVTTAVAGATPEIFLEGCSFEGNRAEREGGGAALNGKLVAHFFDTTWSDNRAGVGGGGVAISSTSAIEQTVRLINNGMLRNDAVTRGGGMLCSQAPGATATVVLENTTISGNTVRGDGAGVYFACGLLNVTGGRFSANKATGGSGGALVLGKQTICGTEKTTIRDVAFDANEAGVGGGVVFFDHVRPTCKLPLLPDGTMNASDDGTWSWSDFGGLVNGNLASYGALQATAPSAISLECVAGDAGNLSGCRTLKLEVGSTVVFESAYPGMEAGLRATMTDWFAQHISGSNAGVGVQIQAAIANSTSSFAVDGLTRFWFDAGVAPISGLRIKGGSEGFLASQPVDQLVFQVPEVLVDYSYLPAAVAELKFGPCPGGFVGARPSADAAYTCVPCPSGRFAAVNADACEPCAAGTFSENAGSSSCTPCPGGHKCPLGSSAPIACQMGQYQASEGSSECVRCELGKYQPRSAALDCEGCPLDRTTAGLGAVSSSECACHTDWYSSTQQSLCERCPVAMECAFGSVLSHFYNSSEASQSIHFPLLSVGYYSSREDPLNVFKCIEATACPGGPPGTCSNDRGENGGFLCMECEEGYYFDKGSCYQCQTHHVLVVIIVGLLVLAGLLYIAKASAKALTLQDPQLILVVTVAGQLLFFLQVSSAIAKLPINWSNPMEMFRFFLTLFSLDMNIFRLECFSVGGQVEHFLIQVLLPIIVVCIFLVLWSAIKVMRPHLLTVTGLVNAIGQLGITLSVGFTLISLVPFHCYTHPNGQRSVQQYPQVICGEGGRHGVMIFIGLLGLAAYPVSVICLVVYANLRYPKMIVSSDMTFINRFRFVFFRWTPDKYWFGGVTIIRNMVLALLPMTIPEENGDVTASLLQLTLLGGLVLTVMYMPWRSQQMNYMDIFLNFILVMVLFIGSMAISHGGVLSEEMCIVTFVLSIVALAFGVIFGLRQLYVSVRGQKSYAVFLSHHKGSGACAARLLKYMLHKELKKPIFYDCDDLTSLSELFTAVKQSNCLLVMLSGETLCRPWCAGEIVTAFQYKVRMVPLVMTSEIDKWATSSEEEQQRIISEQFELLRPYGIPPEGVPESFAHLLGKDPLHLQLCTNGTSLWSTVRRVALACTGACQVAFGSNSSSLVVQVPTASVMSAVGSVEHMGSDNPVESRQSRKIGKEISTKGVKGLIMCDPRNSEAAAAAHLIRQMLQERLQSSIGIDLDLTFETFINAIAASTLRAALFVASPHTTLESAPQLARLGMLYKMRPQISVMPVIIGAGFVFPSQPYFTALEAGKHPISAELDLELPKEMTADDITAALRWTFKGIAKFINISTANQADIDAGMGNIADRVRLMFSDIPGGGPRDSGNCSMQLTVADLITI